MPKKMRAPKNPHRQSITLDLDVDRRWLTQRLVEERLKCSCLLDGHRDLGGADRILLSINWTRCDRDNVASCSLGCGVTANAECESTGSLSVIIAHVTCSPV
jgi:hypothetical protein